MEMRRLARDETPFSQPTGSHCIDIHGRDRSARDETSYPSTNLSSVSLLYCGPPLFNDKCFIAFLGDPWAKHLEGLYKAFIFYPTPTPLGL